MLLCWKIFKNGEGLDGRELAVHTCMLVLVHARVQVNGNNVIVLIIKNNAVFYRSRPGISARVHF